MHGFSQPLGECCPPGTRITPRNSETSRLYQIARDFSSTRSKGASGWVVTVLNPQDSKKPRGPGGRSSLSTKPCVSTVAQPELVRPLRHSRSKDFPYPRPLKSGRTYTQVIYTESRSEDGYGSLASRGTLCLGAYSTNPAKALSTNITLPGTKPEEMSCDIHRALAPGSLQMPGG